jgi:omega-amidase
MRHNRGMDDLRISLVQGATLWHDPAGNRDYYGALIAPLHGITDLVLLPETFTSGFSNDAIDQAETMDGPDRRLDARSRPACSTPPSAAACRCASRRRGRPGLQPAAVRHPGRKLAQVRQAPPVPLRPRARALCAGPRAADLEWRGWRINPLVCYDLRFPVFARNRHGVERPGGLDFDLQLYVANWPAARAYAWKTLLRARAIENLCFVAGLNRVGVDGNGIEYSGDSVVLDFQGKPLSECTDEEVVVTTTLPSAELLAWRERFPGDARRRPPSNCADGPLRMG